MMKVRWINLIQKIRIGYYKFLSSNTNIVGKPIRKQPVFFAGQGNIIFEGKVILGYNPSPFFIGNYIYLEARKQNSQIKIGDQTFINNNLVIIADKGSIEIGANNRIGTNVEIINSDFHHVHPDKRNLSGNSKDIIIGENVFIGNNVKIMKGVTIGNNSVIANGSVVFDNVPANVIVRGNPAEFYKNIER
jgi:maltose O-acetyltransferase